VGVCVCAIYIHGKMINETTKWWGGRRWGPGFKWCWWVVGWGTGYEGNTHHIRTSIHGYVHKVFPTRSFSLSISLPITLSTLFLPAYLLFSISLHVYYHIVYIYIIHRAAADLYTIVHCEGKHAPDILNPRSPVCSSCVQQQVTAAGNFVLAKQFENVQLVSFDDPERWRPSAT